MNVLFTILTIFNLVAAFIGAASARQPQKPPSETTITHHVKCHAPTGTELCPAIWQKTGSDDFSWQNKAAYTGAPARPTAPFEPTTTTEMIQAVWEENTKGSLTWVNKHAYTGAPATKTTSAVTRTSTDEAYCTAGTLVPTPCKAEWSQIDDEPWVFQKELPDTPPPTIVSTVLRWIWNIVETAILLCLGVFFYCWLKSRRYIW